MTFLERKFPFTDLSRLIQSDRRARDPVYGIHRWWARRPPALMRAVLVAATLDSSTTTDDFWKRYATPEPVHLEGLTVCDPFVGGGSTLIEARRLGASVVGGDIDPLAVEITNLALRQGDPKAIRQATRSLTAVLENDYSHLYPEQDAAQPLHYFYVREVSCPECGERTPLFRDKVIGRSLGKHGSVVRDAAVTCFCPEDWSVHQLSDPDAATFKCHGDVLSLYTGTFEHQRFNCPHCGTRSTHSDLRTGRQKRRLVAVERLPRVGRRFIASPTQAEQLLAALAEQELARAGSALRIPDLPIEPVSADGRPISYGLNRYRDLFSARQLLVLGRAFGWVEEADIDQTTRTAFRLGLSNALSTNNLLCGYARDYGRLSPLFQVRGFALPTLSVELNPLVTGAGRGTIESCLQRVAKSFDFQAVKRSTFDTDQRSTVRAEFAFSASRNGRIDVAVRNAEEPEPSERPKADLLVFDPPYFDYINYEELSAFHRAWLDISDSAPLNSLFPDANDQGSSESFGLRLGRAIATAVASRRDNHPIAFTYHSAHADAWAAVGIALDEAKLAVTAAWPVKSDGHMGHHSQYEGACSWDILLVCRPIHEVQLGECPFSAAQLLIEMEPLGVGPADRSNVSFAMDVVAKCYGRYTIDEAR